MSAQSFTALKGKETIAQSSPYSIHHDPDSSCSLEAKMRQFEWHWKKTAPCERNKEWMADRIDSLFNNTEGPWKVKRVAHLWAIFWTLSDFDVKMFPWTIWYWDEDGCFWYQFRTDPTGSRDFDYFPPRLEFQNEQVVDGMDQSTPWADWTWNMHGSFWWNSHTGRTGLKEFDYFPPGYRDKVSQPPRTTNTSAPLKQPQMPQPTERNVSFSNERTKNKERKGKKVRFQLEE